MVYAKQASMKLKKMKVFCLLLVFRQKKNEMQIVRSVEGVSCWFVVFAVAGKMLVLLDAGSAVGVLF